jgi:hypothetical protein
MRAPAVRERIAGIALALLYIGLVIRTSWVGDDAYITFRALENFLHGYGPVFNVGERVQVFTHPLWFLLQAAANWLLQFWPAHPFGAAQLFFLNILLSIDCRFVAAVGCLSARSAARAYLRSFYCCFRRPFSTTPHRGWRTHLHT